MSDLTSLGYPQGYHMGVFAILWWIAIAVTVILSIKLYLNAGKSDLINVKEMLLSKSFVYLGYSIFFSLIQIGVFFPDVFMSVLLFGGFVLGFLTSFYFYYWEKNLTRLKRIPTLSTVTATIIAFIAFLSSLFFPNLIEFIMDYLFFAALSLVTVSIFLYIYMIYDFAKSVKGINMLTGWIWMGGMGLLMLAFFIELPPGVKILPLLFVLYFPPIILMIALSMAFYGINRLFTQISSFYAYTQKCVVHRGTIEKGATIHYCPYCGIVYCETCFTQVIKRDGCWNCLKGADLEIEKEWKVEQVVELRKNGNLEAQVRK